MADARDEEPLRRFGANLRRHRMAAGYSQDRFALDVGVHRTYVGGVERGEINVSLLNVVRFARHLGVSVHDLVDAIE